MVKRCVAAVFTMLWLALPMAAQTPPAPGAGAPSGTVPGATPQAAMPPPATPPIVTPVAAPPPPPPGLPREILDPVERLAKSIEAAEKSIQQLKEIETDLQRVRTTVEQIIYDSTATAEQLRPQLADVKSQIQQLGPLPAAGQPPESPTVAAERARLNAIASGYDSAIKTAELAWVRAKQLIDRITVIRYQAFTRNLFERRASPVMPASLREVGERMPTVLTRTSYYGGDWMGWASRKASTLLPMLLGILVVGGGGWWFVSGLVAERRRHIDPIPTFFDRIASAAWVAPARMLVPASAVILLYTVFDSLDLMFSPWEKPADALLKGALIFIATTSVSRALLAPSEPAWRVIPVDDGTARRLMYAVMVFVAVYVIDNAVNEFGRAIYVPLSVTVAQTFVSNTMSALTLGALLLTPMVPQMGPLRAVNGVDKIDMNNISRHKPYWVKLPLWALTIGIFVTSALGYVALGRFMAQQVVLSGAVLVVSLLAYLAIRAITRERQGNPSRIGAIMERRFHMERSRQWQFAKLIEITLTIALGVIAVPLLLLQWGFAAPDIRDWMRNALFGFEIGGFKISIARILFGIALFTFLLFLTRLVQRMLRDRVAQNAKIDTGIANSVDQAIGYGGIILAALVAVSFAGFDVTNLAIVAGALSVGIGFGLQSIVNNFVSGLILLIERPIKVGDWIVVGDQQGHVRRISVRATEIETFDRASIILPNSELISGRVFNWTHRNVLGRVILKVAVDPTADPERMVAMLRDAAMAHPLLEKLPEPAVGLDYFGSDKLEFTLIATLKDVNQGGKVKSDLRLAILSGCRRMGVIASMIVATKDQPQQTSAPVNGTATPVAGAAQPQPMGAPSAPGGVPVNAAGATTAPSASAPQQAGGSIVPPIPPLKLPSAAG
jgi:potassium-dependent mechanosensitive channel